MVVDGKESSIIISARDVLVEIANEFQNDYLSVARFAECNGLTTPQAHALIKLAQHVRASNHPEA